VRRSSTRTANLSARPPWISGLPRLGEFLTDPRTTTTIHLLDIDIVSQLVRLSLLVQHAYHNLSMSSFHIYCNLLDNTSLIILNVEH